MYLVATQQKQKLTEDSCTLEEVISDNEEITSDEEEKKNIQLANIHEETQLVDNEESIFDSTYILGQSLPPHQIPKMAREESDELFTPNLTRQNSTVSTISDKVHPPPLPSQI